jgi:MFS family permease
LFGALAPGFLAGTLHHPSHALAGIVAALVFGAAGTTQILLRRARTHRQLVLGLSLMSVGLISLTVGVWVPNLALFLVGGVVAGAGAGILFKGTVATVVGLTSPDRRGEALAGLFLAAYVGLTVPVVGIGIATLYIASEKALIGFTVLILLVCAVTSRKLLRHQK